MRRCRQSRCRWCRARAAIEAAGGPALSAVADLSTGVAADDPDRAAAAFDQIADAQQAMLETLLRVPERCDPYVYFHRVRPPMVAWGEPGVVYEGVGTTAQSREAASGAQSSLLQALETSLGISHQGGGGSFLRGMRSYMPPGHRRFLADLEAGPSVRDHIVAGGGNGAMRRQYNDALGQLDTFRRRHMEITVRYLSKHQEKGESAYGTGGTDFVQFLHRTRQETSSYRI